MPKFAVQMTLETLFISTTESAIDCALYTKGMAVLDHAKEKEFDLSKVAAIGDGANDLPFLALEGLCLAGCPANADEAVKAAVLARGGFVSKFEVYLGFLDFSAQCLQRGVEAIYTDRDQTILDKEEFPGALGLATSLRYSGDSGSPFIYVLTGAGQAENKDFIEVINSFYDLEENKFIAADPHIILSENGGVRVNVLNPSESVNMVQKKNPELLAKVLGPFRNSLVKRLESEIAPKFNLGVTYDYGNQKGNAYIATKQTMVSVNVPRSYADGKPYRNTADAGNYRQEMKEAAVDIAKFINIPFSTLEGE